MSDAQLIHLHDYLPGGGDVPLRLHACGDGVELRARLPDWHRRTPALLEDGGVRLLAWLERTFARIDAHAHPQIAQRFTLDNGLGGLWLVQRLPTGQIGAARLAAYIRRFGRTVARLHLYGDALAERVLAESGEGEGGPGYAGWNLLPKQAARA